jgi:hypothetical protein
MATWVVRIAFLDESRSKHEEIDADGIEDAVAKACAIASKPFFTFVGSEERNATMLPQSQIKEVTVAKKRDSRPASQFVAGGEPVVAIPSLPPRRY